MINCFMVPTSQKSCLSSPWHPTLIVGLALLKAPVLGLLPCHLSFSVVDKLCVKQWIIQTHVGCCHNSRQHNKQSQAGHKRVCQDLASLLVIYAWNLSVEGKVMPLQVWCGPEGGWRYSSTLSWLQYYKGVSGQQHAPAALYPRERPGTHCTGGWVGPRASLDRRKNLVPTGIWFRTIQPIVTIPTRLPSLKTFCTSVIYELCLRVDGWMGCLLWWLGDWLTHYNISWQTKLSSISVAIWTVRTVFTGHRKPSATRKCSMVRRWIL